MINLPEIIYEDPIPSTPARDAAMGREMNIDYCMFGVIGISEENAHNLEGDFDPMYFDDTICTCDSCENYRAKEIAYVRKQMVGLLAARASDAAHGDLRIDKTIGVTIEVFDMTVAVCRCHPSKRKVVLRAVRKLRSYTDIERMSHGTL